MTSDNYYVDEYSRLVNRITYDMSDVDSFVEKVAEKAALRKNDNIKLIVVGVATVAIAAVGINWVLRKNKK